MFRYAPTLSTFALIALGCTIIWPTPVQAQLIGGQCNCENLPPTGSGYFTNQQEAIELVKKMLADIRQHSRIEFDDIIQVKEVACPVPRALLCAVRRNGRLGQERLIIYNNDYLNRITQKDAPITWIDRHVLAHEIGHHVLGHLGGTRSLVPLERVYEKETHNSRPPASRYATSTAQARELEADFFGLWLLARTSAQFSFPSFISSFDTTYVRLPGREPVRTTDNPSRSNDRRPKAARVEAQSHPFFSARLQAMQQFWERLKTERRTLASASYFADEADAAYIRLHPDRTFYDVAFVAGLTVAGRPMFRFDGTPVEAILYPLPDATNLYVGLALSRFNWQKSFRIEGDVAWSQQRYGTVLGSRSNRRLLETLDLRYLLVSPKLTWSPLARDGYGSASIRRLGFFVGVGPSVRIPLGFDYQNYAARIDPANQPDLQWSISGRLSVGVELLKKTILPRGYKLALHYEPQRIRLRANPQPRMLSHTVDATLSYTFIRR